LTVKNNFDKFSRCGFELNSSNFYTDNSSFGIVFKFTKKLVQKLGPISLYTLKTGEYIVTKFHNILKPITSLQNSTYFLSLPKSSTSLLREPELVISPRGQGEGDFYFFPCSHQVLKMFSNVFPKMFPIAPGFYPIQFAQSSTPMYIN
jgi:hypothetical protein